MAGLVYCAYQGCLQERYPISHSSCFDVWYRGLPVPPHSLRYVEPFELADCGKDPAPPPVAPLRSMSIGVCNLVIAALNQALAARRWLSLKGLDITQQQQNPEDAFANSPSKLILVLLCCQHADKVVCCPSSKDEPRRAIYLSPVFKKCIFRVLRGKKKQRRPSFVYL